MPYYVSIALFCLGFQKPINLCQRRGVCQHVYEHDDVETFPQFTGIKNPSCAAHADAGVVIILLMTRQDTFHLGSAARVGMEKVLRDAGVLRVLRGMPGGRPGGQVQIDELPLVAGGAHFFC